MLSARCGTITERPGEGTTWLFEQLGEVHASLIDWYERMARDLPWRRTRDPYRILVSEIMLQQTQVDRVIPKYEEFLKRFPTLDALATAPLSEVLRVWSPLGYNRRARYLHLAARAAHERFNGQLPGNLDDLRTLPGLGRYTAGAVGCFGFELITPIVDTNVRRVLGRLIIGQREGLSEAQAWRLAARALPMERAYEWNQALMDLGATVCVADIPKCAQCPVASFCEWKRALDTSGIAPRSVREERAGYGPRPDPGAARRKLRGRIVERLRSAHQQEHTLWESLKASLPTVDNAPDLDELLESLIRDGLVERRMTGQGVEVRLAQS